MLLRRGADKQSKNLQNQTPTDLVRADYRYELFDPEIAQKFEQELLSIPVHEWSMRHVLYWLMIIGQERISYKFMQKNVDGLILVHLDLTDLRMELEIEDWQERVKLFHEISNLLKPKQLQHYEPL